MNKITIINENSIYEKHISDADIMKMDSDIKIYDLNMIKNESRYTISTILVRENSIILAIENIKCIIFPDYVIFFTMFNLPIENIKNLILTNKNNVKPYELKILDCLLSYITSFYSDKINTMIPEIINLISNNTENNIKEIVKRQNCLNKFKIKVNELKDILDELIENEEDKHTINNHFKCQNNFKEIEIILETYENYIQDILNNIEGILKEIEINKNLFSIDLAINRNVFAKMNAKISIISLGISSGTFISSIFGMNLKNNYENSNLAFILIIIFIVLISIITSFLYYVKNKTVFN